MQRRKQEAVLGLVNEKIDVLRRTLQMRLDALAHCEAPYNAAFVPESHREKCREEILSTRAEIAFWEGTRTTVVEPIVRPPDGIPERRANRLQATM